jgi:hypothetical protein
VTTPKLPSAANNAPPAARVVIVLPPAPVRVTMSLDAAEAHARSILAAVERARSGEALPDDEVEIDGPAAPAGGP